MTPAPTADDLASWRRRVVLIETAEPATDGTAGPGLYGSGVVAGAAGLVLTVRHNLCDPLDPSKLLTSVWVSWYDENDTRTKPEAIQVDPEWTDETYDTALLKMRSISVPVPDALSLSKAWQPEAPVLVFGFQRSHERPEDRASRLVFRAPQPVPMKMAKLPEESETLATGKRKLLRLVDDGQPATGAAVQQGYSGGPVVLGSRREARVISLVQGGFESGAAVPPTVVTVPIESFKPLFDKCGLEWRVESPADEAEQDQQRAIQKAIRGFVGREAVLAAWKAFKQNNPSGYFLARAAAGMGLSTLADKVADEESAIRFSVECDTKQHTAASFRSVVCLRLIYRHMQGTPFNPDEDTTNPALLMKLLKEVGEQLKGQNKKLVIVVDGLEQAERVDQGNANPLGLPRKLPDNVYFFVTTHRSGGHELRVKDTPHKELRLCQFGPDNRQTLGSFLNGWLGSEKTDADLTAAGWRRQNFVRYALARSLGKIKRLASIRRQTEREGFRPSRQSQWGGVFSHPVIAALVVLVVCVVAAARIYRELSALPPALPMPLMLVLTCDDGSSHALSPGDTISLRHGQTVTLGANQPAAGSVDYGTLETQRTQQDTFIYRAPHQPDITSDMLRFQPRGGAGDSQPITVTVVDQPCGVCAQGTPCP